MKAAARRWVMAVAFLEGDAGLAQFTEEKVKDREVLKLAARITYWVDPKNEYPKNYSGHLTATLKNGKVMTPCRLGGGEDQGRRAIIHAGSIARRHRTVAASAKRRHPDRRARCGNPPPHSLRSPA